MKTLAAVYCRLSNQGETSESIERQKKLCSDWAKANGLRPVLFVEPAGVHSGFYEKNRPEWSRLKHEIKANPDYAALVVSELSRASRNTLNTLTLINFLDESGIRFVSLKEQFDTSTANGKLFLTISAGVAQWERDMTSERKRSQFRARDKSIYSSNVPPFGLSRTGSYPAIKWETTKDFSVILEMCELYVAGLGAPALAKELNKRGRKWLDRKGKYVPIKETTIRATLVVIERYKPFIPHDLYNKVIAMRQTKRVKHNHMRRTDNPPLLLRGMLHCALCGDTITASTYTSRRDNHSYSYKYYRHRVRGTCAISDKIWREDAVNAHIWKHLEWLDHLSPAQLDAIAHAIVDVPEQTTPDYTAARTKLEHQLKRLVEMRAADELTQAEFLEARDKLRADLAAIPSTPAQVQPEYSFDEIRPLLDNLCQTLQIAAQVDPGAANQSMHGFFARVEWDGHTISALKWHPPFDKLNDKERVLPT